MAQQSKIEGPDLAEEGVALDAFEAGIPIGGQVDGQPVVLVQTTGGIRAVSGKCTHYGGPLSKGLCVGGEIRCPWHHARFDLESGEAVGAPALDPIAVYEIEERDGRVYVTGKRPDHGDRPDPPRSPGSIVIVGSGAAGAAAAEALRRNGYEGPIALVGKEKPVDRPNLSKDYLAGTAQEDWIPLRSEEFYKEAGIDLIEAEVSRVDTAEQVVQLESGETIPYDALLLATGAEPRHIPIPGADLPHVFYLRTFADTKDIISALDGAQRAVIVGAGFIGLEVAASLRQRDVGVTVVAPEEVPLAALIGDALGRFVQDLHEEHGVDFRLGRGVNEIGQKAVTLDDGAVIPADLVVVGIGVVPRTGLADEAGLDTDKGVIVNEHLRTSDPNIWAAGDIARYPGPDSEPVRIEHWVLAERQGQTAARNMLGHDVAFKDPPFFWSQHYDIPINVTGHLGDWDDDVVVGNPSEHDVIVGYSKGGVIKAIATIYRDRENLQAERALAEGDQEWLRNLLVLD